MAERLCLSARVQVSLPAMLLCNGFSLKADIAELKAITITISEVFELSQFPLCGRGAGRTQAVGDAAGARQCDLSCGLAHAFHAHVGNDLLEC